MGCEMDCWKGRVFLGQCNTTDLVKRIAAECIAIAEKVAEQLENSTDDAEWGASKVADAIRERFLLGEKPCNTDSPP